MAYERGQWEKIVRGPELNYGFTDKVPTSDFKSKSDSTGYSDSSSLKSENIYQNCFICGKKVKFDKNEACCKYCGHYFFFDENQKKELLNSLKSEGWKISHDKESNYLSSKFYYHYSSKNEDNIIKYCGDKIISKYKNNKILYVSDSSKRLDSINFYLFKNSNKKLIFDGINKNIDDLTFFFNLNKLGNNIINFKEINKFLNEEFSVIFFNDFENLKYLSYLSVLKNDCKYIDDNTALQLNDFVKLYWDYQNYMDSLNLKINVNHNLIFDYIGKYSKELLNIKKSIIWFSNSINTLNSCYDFLEINCSDIHKQLNILDELSILEFNPSKINCDEATSFIDLLTKYQKIQDINTPLMDRIHNLREKCSAFIDIFKIYFNNVIYSDLFESIADEIQISKKDFIQFSDFYLENNSFNSQINKLTSLDEMNHKLSKIKNLLKINFTDTDEAIKNTKSSINDLFKLIQDNFYLWDDYNFNDMDYELFYKICEDELEKCSLIMNIESQIFGYQKIIDDNLSDIWTGLFSDISKIVTKFKIDKQYSELYNKNIFTENTPKKYNELSKEDINILISINNLSEKEKEIYINLFNNKEELLDKIDILKDLGQDGTLKEYYEIFNEINSILNLDKFDNLIDCLSNLIKYDDYSKYINGYLDKLNQYYELYNNYFDKKEFNISFDELTNTLKSHIMFTELINNKIISRDYLPKINDNISEFLDKVNNLERLSNELILNKKQYDNYKNSSNKETYNVFILDLNTAIKIFNQDYINYFDYVILDDNKFISQENRLKLFLISQNKLLRIWNDGSDKNGE